MTKKIENIKGKYEERKLELFIYDFQVRDDFTNKASKQQTLYSWIFYHSNSKTCAHIPQKICEQDVQRLRRVIHKVYG